MEGERPKAGSCSSTGCGGLSCTGVEAFYIKVLVVRMCVCVCVYLGMGWYYRISTCVSGSLGGKADNIYIKSCANNAKACLKDVVGHVMSSLKTIEIINYLHNPR